MYITIILVHIEHSDNYGIIFAQPIHLQYNKKHWIDELAN